MFQNKISATILDYEAKSPMFYFLNLAISLSQSAKVRDMQTFDKTDFFLLTSLLGNVFVQGQCERYVLTGKWKKFFTAYAALTREYTGKRCS